MRFRSMITDSQQIQNMVKVFQSIAKFSEVFIVRLSESQMQFISDRNCNTSSAALLIRCDLNCDDYFDEYDIKGVNNENNLIYFEMRSECVTQVFNSLTNKVIKSLKMKLINKSGHQMLSIQLDYPTLTDSDRYIRHEIKVSIIRSQFWDTICESDFGSFDLSLYLPEAQSFSSTIERLSDLCPQIVMKAKAVDSSKAILMFGIETESIRIKTKFTDLELNLSDTSASNASEANQSRNWVTVRVDVKKLSQIFNALKNLKPNSISCDLSEKNRIYFQFFFNFVNFRAILPNIDY